MSKTVLSSATTIMSLPPGMSNSQQNNFQAAGLAGHHQKENDHDGHHNLNDPCNCCCPNLKVAQLPLTAHVMNELQWLWPPLWWQLALYYLLPWQWNQLWQSIVIGKVLPAAMLVLIGYADCYWPIHQNSGSSEGMAGGFPVWVVAPEHLQAVVSRAGLLSYGHPISMMVGTLISAVSKAPLFCHLPPTLQRILYSTWSLGLLWYRTVSIHGIAMKLKQV